MAGPVSPAGYPGGFNPGAFNPRGAGQAPPSNDVVKEAVQMALDQAQGAANAVSTFKSHGATSMQELATKGKNDVNLNRVINNTITDPKTSSLQMTYSGNAITIAENSCTKMSKPKTGWFSRKEGLARTYIAEKVKTAKAAGLKTYYGPKGPASAFLDTSFGISTASEAVFKAKTGAELGSSAKAGLTTAVDGLVKLVPHVTPDNAREVANLAGTVKGLADGAEIKLDETKQKSLSDIIEAVEEFDSAKGVAKQVAEQITNSAKQSQQAAPSLAA